MLFRPGLSRYSFTFDNYGANPSSTPGTSVVPGVSNAEGLATVIATGANIAQDCYWLHICVSGGASSGVAKNHLLDIGIDPAGGTSYTWVISNIVCGLSCPIATITSGHHFIFPYFIKAGSQVAVRCQGSHTTAGTIRVTAKFYGQPSNPEAVPVGSFSETLGTITNSSGVSFTPGNAADGTWVSLGTTAKALWWWQLGYQLDNGTTTAEFTYVDLGAGVAGSQRAFMRLHHTALTTEAIGDVRKANLFFPEAYCPVPAGTEMWVRGRCSDAPDIGYNAVAIGIGA